MSEDISCPRCKTSKYRNPLLKLMVNVCGHPLCDNCVDLLFLKGSAACPTCSITLRRTNFRVQLFEDSLVEKEVDIRKRILKDFNKKEDDFETLDEYNNYLEFVETIIYNLTNNIKVESTKRQIENYKKENFEFINRNRGKLSRDEEEIESLLEAEREHEQWKAQVYSQQEMDISKSKKKAAEALVDDLMYSNLPANQILAQHVNEKLKLEQKNFEPPKPPPMKPKPSHVTFSSGIKVGEKVSSLFLPVPKQEEHQVYVYVEPSFDIEGPNPPDVEDLDGNGYLHHVRKIEKSEFAGGFIASYPCQRAIQEAFCGLFYEPDP